ncbi:SigE family RNA polymerase sigma factor [Umezawaea sp. Da 62-37]|uniref:SigE family RNA polymerase sigma factor n=1 Tax=Umezawaea sp. Da 62-37 TaxID=3075927 RepID=UPI0028F6E2D8|nr:SigE family RNA polymerase sigma factor [Umezawaea sp. Da 62-37]WNV88571.1 SigE family RNA polymerase sigma factor [Umezawaea sp. Da 62-37]
MGTDERASFAEYARSRGPWALQVAFRLCRDRHRAQDLAQTSLTKVCARWERLRDVERIDAYVRTVIVRTYIGELRGGWDRWVDLSGTDGERQAPEGADVALGLVLRDAVDGLAPRQRATILLRFYLDLSVEQTAAVLDCTAGTVKSQTSRGLDSLRGMLEKGEVRAA